MVEWFSFPGLPCIAQAARLATNETLPGARTHISGITMKSLASRSCGADFWSQQVRQAVLQAVSNLSGHKLVTPGVSSWMLQCVEHRNLFRVRWFAEGQ